ncbi:MAG: glycyl-radical enzyme activating protein [Oscillospiraceae bacterium]|jgi:pyruvate formate lyase activating enzyme|nr:glycyl-radical enzyme activating protein [Oscillospiraceae bacterium]
METTGKLFDIQGFSVHDGPGIRLTLFLKGCPLRCPWCHSPESLAFHTELNWLEIKCLGIEKCGRCLDACPRGAVSPDSRKSPPDDGGGIRRITVDRTRCNNCDECAKVCAAKALYMCGTDYSVSDIMERIRRDVPFFNRSGGGVTISGGECLCQPEFTLELLNRCHNEGIHTAVDTSGLVEWDVIESVLPYADLFLYDIKGIDATLHERVIGVPNGLILENAHKIASAGGKFQVRVPVIPMYSDSEKTIEDIGVFIRDLGNAVDVVQILPYHCLGTAKWERLQAGLPIFEANPPSGELIATLRKRLENMNLKVMVH